MKITGACHCGAVTIEAPKKPRTLTDCNCSLCRRYGVLWAYYIADTVEVSSTLPQAFDSYSWGGKLIGFHRCRGCGCVTHYTRVNPTKPRPYMAINARMLDLAILEETPLRKLDGARKWRTVSAEPQYKALAPTTKPPATTKRRTTKKRPTTKPVPTKSAVTKKRLSKKPPASKKPAR
jgi:hypothetical protein